MSSSKVYEEVPLEKWLYLDTEERFIYECPCGDLFSLTVDELRAGVRETECPSCSLRVRVLVSDLEEYMKTLANDTRA